MLALRHAFLHTRYSNDQTCDQVNLNHVCDASSVLLDTIRALEGLAKPNMFAFTSATLIDFRKRTPGTKHYRQIRVVGLPMVDEIVSWQIHGQIKERRVNVLVHSICYTHEENRSASWHRTLNGKTMDFQPQYGGPELDDIWQDNNLWRECLNYINLINALERRN